MSLIEYRDLVVLEKLTKLEQDWYPKWVDRYASFLGRAKDQKLVVTQERVIEFNCCRANRDIIVYCMQTT